MELPKEASKVGTKSTLKAETKSKRDEADKARDKAKTRTVKRCSRTTRTDGPNGKKKGPQMNPLVQFMLHARRDNGLCQACRGLFQAHDRLLEVKEEEATRLKDLKDAKSKGGKVLVYPPYVEYNDPEAIESLTTLYRSAKEKSGEEKKAYESRMRKMEDHCCINRACKHTAGESDFYKTRLPPESQFSINEALDTRDASMLAVICSKQASKLLKLTSEARQVNAGEDEEVVWEVVLDNYGAKIARPGDTALHVAARAGSINAIKVLLDFAASSKAKNRDGKTPGEVALDEVTLKAIKEKLDEGMLVKEMTKAHVDMERWAQEVSDFSPESIGEVDRLKQLEAKNTRLQSATQRRLQKMRKLYSTLTRGLLADAEIGEALADSAVEAGRRPDMRGLGEKAAEVNSKTASIQARTEEEQAELVRRRKVQQAKDKFQRIVEGPESRYEWLGGKPIWAGGLSHEGEPRPGMHGTQGGVHDDTEYPNAARQRSEIHLPQEATSLELRPAASANSSDGMASHQHHTNASDWGVEAAPAEGDPSGLSIMGPKHLIKKAGNVLRRVTDWNHGEKPVTPRPLLSHYPSTTAPVSREGMMYTKHEAFREDAGLPETYPVEVAGVQPVGTSSGPQRVGAPRPTPRRWRTQTPEELSLKNKNMDMIRDSEETHPYSMRQGTVKLWQSSDDNMFADMWTRDLSIEKEEPVLVLPQRLTDEAEIRRHNPNWKEGDSGIAPRIEAYVMKRNGAIPGHGTEPDQLWFCHGKVSADISHIKEDWQSEFEANAVPIKAMWTKKAQGGDVSEFETIPAAIIKEKVKAEEEAAQEYAEKLAAGEIPPAGDRPKGYGGDGFTHTEYFWAQSEKHGNEALRLNEKSTDEFAGGAEGLETAQQLRAVGDAHRKRGEWAKAKAAYTAGEDALLMPPEEPMDAIFSAIDDRGDGRMDQDEYGKYLIARGVPEGPFEAAALMGDKDALTRDEWKELAPEYFKDAPEKLEPLVQIGRVGWPDPPDIDRLKKRIKNSSDGSYEKHQLELDLKRQLESRHKNGNVIEPMITYDYDYSSTGEVPVPQMTNTRLNVLHPQKAIGQHPAISLIPSPIKVKEGKPVVTLATDKLHAHTDRAGDVLNNFEEETGDDIS